MFPPHPCPPSRGEGDKEVIFYAMTDIKKFSFSALEIPPRVRWQRGGQGKRIHWSFEDSAAAIGTIEDRLAVLRRVRDEIKVKIEEFLRSES
jgi:hypothetical protein